jgi:hypothetical protein
MIHEQTQKEQNTKIIKRRNEKFQIKNRIVTISTNDFVEAPTIAYNNTLIGLMKTMQLLKR